MNLDLRYYGRSEVVPAGGASWAMRFAPNLARPRVFFDGGLRNPVRFREAVSALHDVVVGDLRFQKKDKTAYEQWRKEQAEAEEELRRAVHDEAKKAELLALSREEIPRNLERDFRKMHSLYWTARRRWANELARTDPALFRALVPCDPVVTVAPDVVFFECFSKDESSYGCLSVDRDAFTGAGDGGLGTTNVDYSLALYDHFQSLRSYRETRLLVDPAGFEVKTAGVAEYREEKIDLPPSWLRGFGQIAAAMALPMERVPLSREAVYSVLAFLRRHREKSGPRSLRFILDPGRPPRLALDPWGTEIPTFGEPWIGAAPQEIRIWGRRRLMVLARLLPLAERFEVLLLGTGLPAFFVAHMGEMRFTLALSGWTSNDWTSGSNLELISGNFAENAELEDRIEDYLDEESFATEAELARQTGASEEAVLAALHALAKKGQAVRDFAKGTWRHRPVMPVALSEKVLGPESPELAAARNLFREKGVRVARREELDENRTLYVAKAGGTSVEGILDGDGKFSRAKCSCSFFHQNRLRKGPCRHLLALRFEVRGVPSLSARPGRVN